MTNLKETAKEYVPKQTLNVTDLESLPLNLEVEDGEGMDKDGKPFEYKFVVIDGQDYRVSNKVLEDIQTLLTAKPTLEKVKVTKTGSGVATRYKVVALE